MPNGKTSSVIEARHQLRGEGSRGFRWGAPTLSKRQPSPCSEPASDVRSPTRSLPSSRQVVKYALTCALRTLVVTSKVGTTTAHAPLRLPQCKRPGTGCGSGDERVSSSVDPVSSGPAWLLACNACHPQDDALASGRLPDERACAATTSHPRVRPDPTDNGGHDGGSRVPRRRGLPGGDRPHHRRVEPGMAGAGPRPEGRAERAVRRPRRHRLRQAGLLRQPHRDAELRRARRRRPALQQHAHHGAVLAEPLLHRHRAQPPQQRHGRASPSSPPATPATTASCPSRTACSRRCCSSTATTPTWSASGT